MNAIRRLATDHLRALAGRHPVVTVTGPRQSGKTTLVRSCFPDLRYVSLEQPDVRAYASRDPRALLAEIRGGAILDEVQRAPDLLSYLQTEVDLDPRPGRFILTGSANLGLLESVTQSLAGRTALLTLLPFTQDETRGFPGAPEELWDAVWRGGYPAPFDRELPVQEWLADYVSTYVERDVRQLLNIGDLNAFAAFLRLAAAHAGQLVNLSQLGADAGVSHNTARAWLSVLEASYLVLRLPPLHANLAKRLVKTPKLIWLDSGLVCYLLGITSAALLRHHPLRGALFETWVIGEVLKRRASLGLPFRCLFYRDRAGLEVDLLVERGGTLTAVECKSGATVADDFFSGLARLGTLLEGTDLLGPRRFEGRLVHGGEARQRRTLADVLPWSALGEVDWGDGE